MSQRFYNSGFGGLGAVYDSDPDYTGAVSAASRAHALRNFETLFSENADFFNNVANIDNTLAAIQSGQIPIASVSAMLANRTLWLNNFLAGASVIALSPSQQRPDIAEVVRGFYRTYLHREADQEGLEFWVQGAINTTVADVERAFQVQAANDAAATNAGATAAAQTAAAQQAAAQAQAQATAARAAQQAAEARAAELQAAINALNAQAAAGGNAEALHTQVIALQAQLAEAQTAAAAAAAAANTHETAAASFLSRIETYASSHKLIVGAIAVGALFVFGGFGGTGKKR